MEVIDLRKSLQAKIEESAEAPVSTSDDKRDELMRDRDSLRLEVTELRKSLEDTRSKHDEELGSVKEQLEETQSAKSHAETQYRNLVGKVNTIKSQLGERLKADAVCPLPVAVFHDGY